MLELASAVIIPAIVMSFAADVMFRAVTFVAPRRKSSVQLAAEEMSA